MRIQKVIEDNISLSTAELFSGNIQQVILDKLKFKYERKCWDNSYVVEVVEILKRSSIKMARDRLNGQGDANVQFLVNAVVYPTGDILVGCVIDNILKHDRIICVQGDINITTAEGFFIDPKLGQLLTLQVVDVNYRQPDGTLMIYASPHLINKRPVLYKFPKMTSFTRDQKDLLQMALTRLGDAHERFRKASRSASVKFFEDKVYPYNETHAKVMAKLKTDGYNIVNMEEISTNIVNGKIKSIGSENMLGYMKHPSISMSTPNVYELDPTKWESGVKKMIHMAPEKVVDKTFIDLAVSVLNEHSIYLNMIADMSEVYNTDEIRNKHENIWKSYVNVQLS